MLKVDKVRFNDRLQNEVDIYNNQCLFLHEGKPSEMEVVEKLSVYRFELLLIQKGYYIKK